MRGADMTPTIDTQIWEALRAAVATAAGALPVAYPGEEFTPPSTSTRQLPYIAMGGTATAARAVISRTGALERTGIITLVHVAPIGYNAAWYVERASDLLAGFPLDGCSRYDSVTVRWGNGLSVPRLERGFRENGYIRTPVLIPWRCAA